MEAFNTTIYDPYYLDIDNNPGKQLVSFSTLFTALFVVLIQLVYSFRTFVFNRNHINVMVSRWDRVQVTVYCFIAVLFEIESNYGYKIADKGDWHGPSLISVLSWLACNVFSVMLLIPALFSRVRYRAFIWLPFSLHAMITWVIFCEMSVRSHFSYDIIIPVFMAFMSTGICFKVPWIFQIDASRFLFEKQKGEQRSTHIAVMDTTEMETDRFIKVNVDNVTGALSKQTYEEPSYDKQT